MNYRRFWAISTQMILEYLANSNKSGSQVNAPLFACGYNYDIYVVRDSTVLESFSINLESGCNTVAAEQGHFWFNPRKLSAFNRKLKKAVIESVNFPSVEKARSFIKSLPKDELLMVVEPRWLEYDGEFRFEVPCDFDNFDDNLIQKCVARTREQIAVTYPGERFAVEQAGYSSRRNVSAGTTKAILIRMKCKKHLYDKFDLFKPHWDWEDYSSTLKIVRKTGHEQKDRRDP
jgi:hypothetical protein